jgi:peptide deformylase
MTAMMEEQSGVGLAAPQVGVLQRFLVMMNPDDKTVFKMINPRFISKSDKTCVMEEGCLSVLGSDGLPVYAKIARPAAVEVEWTDEDGKPMRAQLSGYAARIIQHEADHLDGVLFIDYLSPLRREMLMRKVKKFKK